MATQQATPATHSNACADLMDKPNGLSEAIEAALPGTATANKGGRCRIKKDKANIPRPHTMPIQM
jgi:hypothetical protein